ncbi:hypothetical protein CL634_00030 [bacterium]|nr:hypothetical protein [bacterium]
MSYSYTTFSKVENVGDSTVGPLLRDNVIEFFDWAFLEAGGFTNIDVKVHAGSGIYGDYRADLRLVNDPNFTNGQVWESFHSNWVWESGMARDHQPLVMTNLRPDHTNYPNQRRLPGASGVFVGTVFQPTSGVGPYAHYIDYPNGRVVFDSAISTTSTVTASYSYKNFNVVPADSNFFREIQDRVERGEEDFNYSGSGDYTQLGQTRLQLPAIAVEVVNRRTLEPYQLGGTHYINSDLLFHVLAEDDYTRDKLLDVISYQDEKMIRMFDSDRIGRSGVFPLDYRGSTTNTDKDGNITNSLRYPELVQTSGNGGYRHSYYDGSILLKDAKVQQHDAISPNLYHGTVRLTAEVVK